MSNHYYYCYCYCYCYYYYYYYHYYYYYYYSDYYLPSSAVVFAAALKASSDLSALMTVAFMTKNCWLS